MRDPAVIQRRSTYRSKKPTLAWAFVMMLPCASTMTPDPRPLPVWITTTDWLTRLMTEMNWSSRAAGLPPTCWAVVGVVSLAGADAPPPPQAASASAATHHTNQYRAAAQLTQASSRTHQPR